MADSPCASYSPGRWNYYVSNSVRDDVPSPRTTRIPSEHARHDRLLVTRYAANDAFASEVAEARALVANCPQCAALAADIQLISAATGRLPMPRRPRDFRLSAEQADTLRGSAIERFLRRLTGPGFAPLRPVAGAAMSLGLALAVVGAALPAPVAVDETGRDVQVMQAPAEGAGEQRDVEVPGDAVAPGALPYQEAAPPPA